MKTPTPSAIAVIVIGCAVILAIRGRLARNAVAPDPLQPLMGKWVLESAPPGKPDPKRPQAARTELLFSKGGVERVVVWLPAPHHPRPRPVSIPAHYRVTGNTIVQTSWPHSLAFSGLGLAVTENKVGASLTARFVVHDDYLTLSQAELSEAVTFVHTVTAAPPGAGVVIPEIRR